MFPNIHTILKVLLTIPVSTASAERSFSGLQRLKTYLHSDMSETRLSGLALLHIHHDTDIDIPEIVREFDTCGRLSGLALLHIHHDTDIDIPEIVREFDTCGRLSGLALLHIHHDTDIDIPEIVREFDTRG